jgi:hypothetical protein
MMTDETAADSAYRKTRMAVEDVQENMRDAVETDHKNGIMILFSLALMW